jgi:hypothetical protein
VNGYADDDGDGFASLWVCCVMVLLGVKSRKNTFAMSRRRGRHAVAGALQAHDVAHHNAGTLPGVSTAFRNRFRSLARLLRLATALLAGQLLRMRGLMRGQQHAGSDIGTGPSTSGQHLPVAAPFRAQHRRSSRPDIKTNAGAPTVEAKRTEPLPKEELVKYIASGCKPRDKWRQVGEHSILASKLHKQPFSQELFFVLPVLLTCRAPLHVAPVQC